MGRLMKNKYVRQAAALLLAVCLLLMACGCFLIYRNGEKTIQLLMEQDYDMIGAMADGAEIGRLSLLTGEIDPHNAAKGKEILSGYGYDANAPAKIYPYYQSLIQDQISLFLCLFALFFLLALGVFMGGMAGIYRKIRALHQAASTYHFETGVAVSHYSEGDLAALENAIQGLGDRVSYHIRSLDKDKEYLKNLLSDISHQLKTPLAALRMYIEILTERDSLSQERKQEFLRLCKEQIDRTDWLVQGLLKMTRVEAGAVQMHLRECYLADTVEQAVSPFMEMARCKGVSLEVRTPGEILFCHDRDWVAEAVGNLIKNALEHTPAGGKVQITANQTPLIAELHIKDNGCGMDTTEIPHVFERFYSKNTAPDSRNVGIGLSLAKEIIEKNHGSIYVKSTLGEGSEFTLTFLKGQS